MILKKLLVGDLAGLFLPFALSRLRTMQRRDPEGFFTEKFEQSGYSIEVRQAPPYQFARIQEIGSLYFEFATSGNPIATGLLTEDGDDFETYKGCVIGVNATANGGSLQTTAGVLGHDRSAVAGVDFSTIRRPYQIQLVNEPVAYPQALGTITPVALYESWAPGHPHTAVHLRDTQTLAGVSLDNLVNNPVLPSINLGPLMQHDSRDVGYDVPFERNARKEAVVTAYIKGAADWPRACGLQQVTHATLPTREFAVYVDTFNQFTVFPIGAIGAVTSGTTTQNVPEIYVQRLTPTLPAWAFLPGTKFADRFGADPVEFLANSFIDTPELDWHFNHLGTKAVTIVYEREPYTYDAAYWAINPSGTPFDAARFAIRQTQMSAPQMAGAVAVGSVPDDGTGAINQRYFVAPGVLEVGVNIVLTGPNLEDFTATLSATREVRRPTTSPYCSLQVGYVWHASKIGTTTILPGTLVSLDVEHYGSVAGQTNTLLSLKNLNTEAEITTFPGVPLIACDLNTLSFVLRAQSLTLVNKTVNGKATGGADPTYTGDWIHNPFGAAIYTQGKLREILYPATMSADDKLVVAAVMAVDARAVMTASGYAFVPLNQSLDGFAHAGFSAYRDWWAGFMGYKTTHPSQPAGINTLMNGTWRAGAHDLSGHGNDHLMLCDNPKWGWHLYAGVLCAHMWMCSLNTTFYTHPNGSYAFFDNTSLFMGQDTIAPFGFFQEADALPLFDASLVEHVIFDRVHLQVRGLSVNTTFRELYNKAVTYGISNGSLAAGINTMALSDMRATFTKEITTVSGDDFYGVHFTNLQFLDLKADWDGASYWHHDPVIQGGTYAEVLFRAPGWGGTVGLTMGHPWTTTPMTELSDVGGSEQVYPASAAKHVRFANPQLLGA